MTTAPTHHPTDPGATSAPTPVEVVDLDAVGRGDTALVGGKGAHLGELRGLDAVRVPDGFCITTAAFDRVVAGDPAIAAVVSILDDAGEGDAGPGGTGRAAALRAAVEEVVLPDDLAAAITTAVEGLGDGTVLAVRSSATAEDLATASFAGQQDSWLDVVGAAAVLDHVRRCWASLFTERAVAYRGRAGIPHHEVRMAVVVQRTVPARAAGVLFTADPVTGDRRVAAVEAVAGLGDALVSGRARPDPFTVRDDRVERRRDDRDRPAVLTDAEVLRIVEVGRRIEAHLGHPQDVEWCLAGDDVHVVQSRPITTAFPVPADDGDADRVYVSVGHQQMMTDPMKPLGSSLFQLLARAPMREAGGRLWVDVTAALASPVARDGLLAVFSRSAPLVADALRSLVERGDLTLPRAIEATPPAGAPPPPAHEDEHPEAAPDPDPEVIARLVQRTDAAVEEAARRLATATGSTLLALIRDDLAEAQRLLFDPESHTALMAGMDAVEWLDEHLEAWLGEPGAAAALIEAAPGDVTAEMGLALLDVADAIRPHAEVIAFLETVDPEAGDAAFLDDLAGLDGGPEARAAIEAWLAAHGMRCPGEIDITRPRWTERPAALVPTLLGHVRDRAPGERRRREVEGRRRAAAAAEDVVTRLRAQPDGAERAPAAERMIDRARTFIGYREHPKAGMIRRFGLYRDALLGEGDRLVRAGVLATAEDISHLTFDELEEAVRDQHVDAALVARRAEEHRAHARLVPPWVLTSHGEAVSGSYGRTDVPDGALVGLAVSAGVVEGRARVVTDLARARLEPGDVLVTTFTDPGWTPVFATIAGLVTEVGGAMTHGAVVAREYGLAAVVGVEGATRHIVDGQQIRVHGTRGYVELLS